MINLTDKPIAIVSKKVLATLTRESLTWSIDEFRLLAPTSSFSHKHKAIFSTEFSEGVQKRALDSGFLVAAFEWANSDERHLGNSALLVDLKRYFPLEGLTAHAYSTCKRGLKMMLVHLWSIGAVTLPTRFLSGPYFPFDAFESPLMKWLRAPSEDDGQDGKRTAAWRLKNYGHRLLWLTSWRQPEDISLTELAELQNANTSSQNGNYSHELSGSQLPCIDFAYKALSDFADRVPFSREDFDRYQNWSNLPAEIRGAAGEFDNRRPPRVKKNYPKKYKRRESRSIESGSENNPLGLAVDKSMMVSHHNKACLYMAKRMQLSSWRWKSEVSIDYVGRAHIDTLEIMRVWRRVMLDFTQTRRIEGKLSVKGVNSALCFLTDYLCLYLPWWSEQFGIDIPIPRSPKEFNRYIFVHRDDNKGVDELPLTFIDFVKLRRTSASTTYSVIRLICSLFRSAATSFSDDASIAGPGFVVPIAEEFDLLPESRRLSKSNKNVIPKGIYPHLISYAHGIEEFGRFLLDQVLAGELNASQVSTLPRFDCERWGYVPCYFYRGKLVYIKSVPNVFNWIERRLVRGDMLVVPHSGGHRINLSMLETGLRGQSVQWLDRDTFDYLNADVGEWEKTYDLYLNTDKTRSPYPTVVIHRVMKLMRRERDFQQLFVEYASQGYIKYEDRDFSAILKPLFRAGSTDNVISDSLYARSWQKLMVEFEFFFNSFSAERCMPFYSIKPRYDLDGEVKIESAYASGDYPYCPISIVLVHTPHSARTTFITNRQGPGGFSLEEASTLVGHSGVVPTGYYTKPSREQLHESVARFDGALFGDFVCFDSNEPSSTYIRADKSDSAFRCSFERDRNQTIKVFGVQAKGIWSLSDKQRQDPAFDGLELLKSGPMSRIVFRPTHVCPVGEECPQEVIDHCGGEARRCGMCPLACKSIDHLPAISAKAHSMRLNISFIKRKIQSMEASGESESATEEFWNLLSRDATECAGWELDERLLRAELEAAKAEQRTASNDFLVKQPESVAQHLTYVTRDLSMAQFMLQHLGETNVYRGMLTETQLAQSTLLRKKLIASIGEDAYGQLPPAIDAVADTARMLALQLRASGKTLQQIGFESDLEMALLGG